MNPKVDVFLKKAKSWRKEIEALRAIALESGLNEELKWGKPCYTFDERNVAIIIPLKESCAFMFCQGALLQDKAGVLTRPGENTQAGRWIKFGTVQEIAKRRALVQTYLQEAIAAEKAGLKVQLKKTSEPVPAELQNKLDQTPALKKAFAALTPGRQRAYILYFSAAKQAKTREARIEKCAPRMLRGKGLND